MTSSSLGFTTKLRTRRRKRVIRRPQQQQQRSKSDGEEDIVERDISPLRRRGRSASPIRTSSSAPLHPPPLLVSRRIRRQKGRTGRRRRRRVEKQLDDVEAEDEDETEEDEDVVAHHAYEATFWPVINNTRNVDVVVDLPWRWFRVNGVVFVRGSLQLKFDNATYKPGVGAFDIEALPMRAARFNGYRQMEAYLSGFVRNASKNYPLYGVPHGKMRSIRCYFDVDAALLASSSTAPIAMVGGHYDVD